jgi:hypothetical protein
MSRPPAFARRPELAGRAGLTATGVSIALTFAVAVTGTSVMEPPYPGRRGQPPWAVSAHLSPYLAVALTAAALAAGTIGLALTMTAMRRGWVFPARYVLVVGLLAAAVLTLVPPFGSSDPLSYAAYGRMLVTGHNPYATGPDLLARLGDPVARAVQDWSTAPSDYGTVATAGQALASLIGGTSTRLTVFVLSLLDLAAFADTGLLLHRMARGDRSRQIRAALLWTCNPLLLQVLVSGEHVDSQAMVFGVAALAVFGPVLAGPARPAALPVVLRAAGAGALVGLGFAVKVTIALIGAGLAVAAIRAFWPPAGRAHGTGGPERAGWRGLAAMLGGLAGGFAVTAGAALAIGGPDGLRQTVRASSMVSIGSPWRAVRSVVHLAVAEPAADDVVKTAAAVLAVVLAVLLLRGLLGGRPGDLPGTTWEAPREAGGSTPVLVRLKKIRRERGDGPGATAGPPGAVLSGAASVSGAALAGAAALAFSLAWLLAWPYVLPWYDGLAWALLPLVAVSSLDWLLLARTAGLAFGYLPARVAGVVMPPGLGWLQSAVRTAVTPAILAAVIVGLIVSLRRGRERSAEPSGPAGPAGGSGAGPCGSSVAWPGGSSAAWPGGIRRPAADGRMNR